MGNGVENLKNGVEDKLVEGTLQRLALVLTNFRPFLRLRVKEVVSLLLMSTEIPARIQRACRTHPKALHHLVLVNAKFLGIFDSELPNREGPSVEARPKGDSSLVWINLDIA
jgi:hypothetical protein